MCLFCDSSFVFERHIARLDDDERVSARLGSARLAPLSSHRLASPRLAMSRRRVIDLISATVARARVASSTSRASGASRPRALDGFRNVAPREPSTSARALPRAPSARGFAAEANEAATPHPDGMPRFPEPSVAGALRLADYVGTSSFAMTGSLLAASSGMDAFGCAAVGTITAVGGGTVRDILLGRGRRAFWMEEQEYLWIATGTALATFFGWEEAKKRFGFADDDYWIEAGDALGVGAFCVIGAQNGIRAGVPMIAQMLCGVMTATFGGIVRDILVQRPTRIFHSYADIYATTAATGALVYITARGIGLPPAVRIISGVSAGVALRVAADTYDIRLPVYNSEPSKQSALGKGDKRHA